MRVLATAVVAASAVAALAAPVPSPWIRVTLDAAGGDPDGNCGEPAITPNGRFVAFHSAATDLVGDDGNGQTDVFVRDRKTGTTELVSRTPAGAPANNLSFYGSISNNGRWVVFQSTATDLVPGDEGHTDIFAADRAAGTVAMVSEGFDGSPGNAESTMYGSCLSGNGRWAVFVSLATNLVEGVETNGYYQVYMRDLRTGTTTLVSRDRDDPAYGASGTCSNPSISANGRFVAFTCNSANLVPGSSNGQMHVYVRDMKTGATTRVSASEAGDLGNSGSFEPVVSNNGRIVAFYSYASNLVPGDTNVNYDTFLADLKAGTLVRISDSTDVGEGSYHAAVSANGKTVVFYSDQADLVEGDGNAYSDAFRYDPKTGIVTRLSVDAEGAEGNGTTYFYGSSLSSNGKWLAVTTSASNLAGPPEAEETIYDVYVKAIR